MHPLLMTLLTILGVLGGTLGVCSYLIYIERKLAAFIQDRVGPNRVGPFGLLQPIADGLKFLLKEDVIPAHVDKFLFLLSPAIAVFTTLLAFSVVPFGGGSGQEGAFPWIIAPNVDLGIVFIFAVSSLAVYGVILGGWASNNKYSMMGSLRASAQVISYELPLGMSVLGVALLSGTLNLEKVIQVQAEGGLQGWNLWCQPLAGLLFFTAALAESNRLPFDLSECEQELIGGYHTEYSALKFALFFLAEYTHLITTSFLTAILFLGGWQFPWIAQADSAYAGVAFVKCFVLAAKVMSCILLIMFLRWTLPRFRFDQLMGLAWKVMIPLSIMNVVLTMIVREFDLSRWWLLLASLVLFVGAGFVSLDPIGRSRSTRRRPAAVPVAGGHSHAH